MAADQLSLLACVLRSGFELPLLACVLRLGLSNAHPRVVNLFRCLCIIPIRYLKMWKPLLHMHVPEI